MSVMGQERTLAALDFMSAIPPITDVISGKTDIGDCTSGFGIKQTKSLGKRTLRPRVIQCSACGRGLRPVPPPG